MKLPVMNKAQKRLIWIAFFVDIIFLVVTPSRNHVSFLTFLIVAIILLYWLLGQPKEQK
jgi:hypothetical protein